MIYSCRFLEVYEVSNYFDLAFFYSVEVWYDSQKNKQTNSSFALIDLS